jgi:hypothetical protein
MIALRIQDDIAADELQAEHGAKMTAGSARG